MEFGDEISQEQLLDLCVFYSKSKRKDSYLTQLGFTEGEIKKNNIKEMVEKHFLDIENGEKESSLLMVASSMYITYFPDPDDKIANAIKSKNYEVLKSLVRKSKIEGTDPLKYQLLIALNDDVEAEKILEPHLDDTMKIIGQEMISEAPPQLIHYYLSHKNKEIRQKSTEQFIKDFERQSHLSDPDKMLIFSSAIIAIYESDKTKDKSDLSRFLNSEQIKHLNITKIEEGYFNEASKKFIENNSSIKILSACKDFVEYQLVKNKNANPRLKNLIKVTSLFFDNCINYIKNKKVAKIKKALNNKHIKISRSIAHDESLISIIDGLKTQNPNSLKPKKLANNIAIRI
jgi:hypothetical protein